MIQIPDDVEAIHQIAVALDIRFEQRQHLRAYGRMPYEINMLNPNEPRRRSYRGGPDLPLWLEWHRVRGHDPYAYNSRGYHLAAPIRAAVIERDGYACGICGEDVELCGVHIDHIKPRFHGGSDDLDNLRVTHSFCNLSKGAKVDRCLPVSAR